MEGAHAVVSLVGLLAATEKEMVDVQQDGARRVADAAKEKGVERVVMISAIGADKNGVTPYQRTKAAAEEYFLSLHPTATVIRPSIVFGPGDSFFTRFAEMAKWLPFLPVFGGGTTKFQPVYVGDLARAVEICCRDDAKVVDMVGGRIIEAGGPDILTYREIMNLTLLHSQRRRPIISLPFWVGTLQAFFLERLPQSLFTLTRDQVKQLRVDNIVSPHPLVNSVNFQDLLRAFPSNSPSSVVETDLVSVHQILPTYLTPQTKENGKRTHGRHTSLGSLEEFKKMSGK
ncbi:NADH dehydrogenase [Tremella mesenterica]|uniref:NADH dehydrogenase n=2 Tax=Tremella mesenterica TaxID=5217 RepID=A0A4Q1BQE5_TREME|nr:NADH dehydrogenase [Tremella mesenterica]